MSTVNSEPATKSDLAVLETNLKQEMLEHKAELRTEMRAEFQQVDEHFEKVDEHLERIDRQFEELRADMARQFQAQTEYILHQVNIIVNG